MKKLMKLFTYSVFVAIPLIFASCYPGGLEYYSESDIVLTNYDPAFNFSTNKLYFMPDTIHHVVEEGKEDEVDRTYDDEMLDLIATNMDAAGYTRLEDPELPDSVLVDSANVVLAVIVTSSKYSGIGYIPGGGGWWGWYPGWGWGGGYYPGYPWYPGYGWGYPYYYSYSTGSLFIEMVDEDSIVPAEEIVPITWQVSINGLLSSNEQNMITRVTNSINQAFKQSPYLSN